MQKETINPDNGTIPYADYIQIGSVLFMTWIFPGMEYELNERFRHLFWRFYKLKK